MDAATLSELVQLLIDDDPLHDEPGIPRGDSDDRFASSSPAETGSMALSAHPPTTYKDQPRKRIRRVGSVPYSTDLQRRRKNELLSLRCQVQELEELLAQLQQAHIGEAVACGKYRYSRTEPEQWREVSIVARKELDRAECTNRELKDILAQRHGVLASIRDLLERNNLREGIESSLPTQSNGSRSLTCLDTADAVLKEISAGLEQLHLRADSVFPARDLYHTVALRTRNKCRDLSANCTETISVTPMPCTVSSSGRLLWQQLIRRRDVEPDKLYRFIRAKQDTCLEMNFTLPLRDENDALLSLDAVSAYRMYEEKHRTVLVGNTTWVLRNGGLECETLHWTVISPSPKGQPETSVVQSCNLLRAKNLDPTSAQAIRVRTMVLTSIGTKLRSFMETVQNGLLCGAPTSM